MTIRLLRCGALALLFPLGGVVAQEPATAPKKPSPPVRVNYDLAKQLFGGDPTSTPVDNPATPEKLALGKLIYEAKLGKAGARCADCHDLAKYGQDGKTHGRNTPTIWNAARQYSQFWDARALTVEEAVFVPPKNDLVHGVADEAELLASLRGSDELSKAFAAAFPGADAVSIANYRLALGVYLRSLATKSKFDEYLDGNQKALDNDQKLGLKLFMDVGCITCHTTRLLGGHMIQKSGLLKPYPTEDTGRARLTGSDADKGFFKVPTLRNVEKTAPYYHDGKVATLEEAVTKMADMQLNKQLKPEEVTAIVAFLKALTGALPDETKKN